MRPALQVAPQPGVCNGCGCVDDSACLDPATREPCFWVDEDETWCSLCAAVYAAFVFRADSFVGFRFTPAEGVIV